MLLGSLMSTKLLMDVQEYLRTSFEGSDCEYLDGEVVERNMGELPHSRIQTGLLRKLLRLRPELGILPLSEIRIQINPHRFRVAARHRRLAERRHRHNYPDRAAFPGC